MTFKSEHQMGCAADFGPSAAGTRLANHTAAEGGCRCVHRHQPRTPSETRGSAFPSARGEAPPLTSSTCAFAAFAFPSALGETRAGAELDLTLRTRPCVEDGAVHGAGRTAVPAAA